MKEKLISETLFAELATAAFAYRSNVRDCGEIMGNRPEYFALLEYIGSSKDATMFSRRLIKRFNALNAVKVHMI